MKSDTVYPTKDICDPALGFQRLKGFYIMTISMTPRERVLATLNHKEPDRVPLDPGGAEVTGMHGIAYNNFKAHLGITDGTTQLFHMYMQLAAMEESVRQRCHGNIALLFQPASGQNKIGNTLMTAKGCLNGIHCRHIGA